MSARNRTMRWAGLGVLLVLAGLGALAQGMSPATTGGQGSASQYTVQDSNGSCVLSNGAGPVASESCPLTVGGNLVVTGTGSFNAGVNQFNPSLNQFTNTGMVGYLQMGAQTIYANANPVLLMGQLADGASFVGVAVGSQATVANAGAKLLSLRNGVAEKTYFDLNGQLTYGATVYGSSVSGAVNITASNTIQAQTNLQAGTGATSIYLQNQRVIYPYTDNSGTPGPTTISQGSGRAAIAIAASSALVTNTLVSATTIVRVQLESTGCGVGSLVVVPAAGTFTVTGVNAAGAATVAAGVACKFSFVIANT